MKIKTDKLFIILFIVICMAPSVGMLIAGPSEAAANEMLSPKPKMTKQNGSFDFSFLSAASDWFDDRFAFRQEMASSWAKINSLFFHTSVNEDVILGTDDWLYFADTAEDFSGVLLSDSTIEAAAARLSELQKYCDDHGILFVFTVAPNKNSLYPENMPACYPKGEQNNVSRLYRRLDQLGVCYTDLHEAFRQKDEILYYKTDSHWNEKGAALAADSLLTMLGVNSGYYLFGFTEGDVHEGDLFRMLYPSGKAEEQKLKWNGDFTFECKNDARKGEAIEFSTYCDTGKRNLLCWRDSFGVSLYPYLAQTFENSDFLRSTDYSVQKIEEGNYDAVILEIVERNISWLARE